jgi:gamma-tubulin complex component 4
MIWGGLSGSKIIEYRHASTFTVLPNMIAEVLLLLAGHSSSLFPGKDSTLNPAFIPLLHPGEAQCLESLGLIALRYRKIKESCAALGTSSSQYICALSSSLQRFLRDEYESLVIETEAKVLKREPGLVANGSFVPLSSIRATFSEWDAPLAALQSLIEELDKKSPWQPGPLIDMLQARACTGVHRVASVLSKLSRDVQRVWRTRAIAFMVHGNTEGSDTLASSDYKLLDQSIPACISPQTRESIAYIGRAIGTVKAAKWRRQLPRTLALEYTRQLEAALPEERHAFDGAVTEIRMSVSEWLWVYVLTRKDVDEAVDSLYVLNSAPH